MGNVKKVRSAQIGSDQHKADRPAFWQYCQRAEAMARHRAKKLKVPFDIDAHYLDQLLVDKEFSCAVSNIPLNSPGISNRDPFAPSLDRIEPDLGYVRGNVRIVCCIVNTAMSNWGLTNLLLLVKAMALIAPVHDTGDLDWLNEIKMVKETEPE